MMEHAISPVLIIIILHNSIYSFSFLIHLKKFRVSHILLLQAASKKKDRQSVKPSANFTIPVRVSCVTSDANDSSASLIWELVFQVGPKTKVYELWEWIRQGGKLEGPDSHALCKDDEVLNEKEYLNKYKIKQNVCLHFPFSYYYIFVKC